MSKTLTLSGGIGVDREGCYWAFLEYGSDRVMRGPYASHDEAADAIRLFAQLYERLFGVRCHVIITRVRMPPQPN